MLILRFMKTNYTLLLINRYGMTVEEIAVAVKASASSVRNWRNGMQPLPVYREQLAKIVEEKRRTA